MEYFMATKPGRTPIHINPRNEGKFKKSTPKGQTPLEHAKNIMKDPKATALQRKRAGFVINSSKWKKGGK